MFLKRKNWKIAAGLDFSHNMLQQAAKDLGSQVKLAGGDFHDLPFRQGSFDLVVSSFTLRSVKEMPRFLREIYEILSEKGKAAFLCLTRPQHPVWKAVYYPYLKFYLPLVGRAVTGNSEAYQFLSQARKSVV